MGDGPVVRHAQHERAFGALAAEARQRAPQREEDLLQQILSRRGVALVRPGDAPQLGAVGAEHALELGAVVGHQRAPATPTVARVAVVVTEGSSSRSETAGRGPSAL